MVLQWAARACRLRRSQRASIVRDGARKWAADARAEWKMTDIDRLGRVANLLTFICAGQVRAHEGVAGDARGRAFCGLALGGSLESPFQILCRNSKGVVIR